MQLSLLYKQVQSNLSCVILQGNSEIWSQKCREKTYFHCSICFFFVSVNIILFHKYTFNKYTMQNGIRKSSQHFCFC